MSSPSSSSSPPLGEEEGEDHGVVPMEVSVEPLDLLRRAATDCIAQQWSQVIFDPQGTAYYHGVRVLKPTETRLLVTIDTIVEARDYQMLRVIQRAWYAHASPHTMWFKRIQAYNNQVPLWKFKLEDSYYPRTSLPQADLLSLVHPEGTRLVAYSADPVDAPHRRIHAYEILPSGLVDYVCGMVRSGTCELRVVTCGCPELSALADPNGNVSLYRIHCTAASLERMRNTAVPVTIATRHAVVRGFHPDARARERADGAFEVTYPPTARRLWNTVAARLDAEMWSIAGRWVTPEVQNQDSHISIIKCFMHALREVTTTFRSYSAAQHICIARFVYGIALYERLQAKLAVVRTAAASATLPMRKSCHASSSSSAVPFSIFSSSSGRGGGTANVTQAARAGAAGRAGSSTSAVVSESKR
jgi:hypothetical protein